MIAPDKPSLLRRHDFFADLPDTTIGRLAAHARVLTVAEGDRIFSKGDADARLVAVVAGLVRISVPSEGATELIVRIIPRNEVFGEIALLDGQPRTAHATAATDCQLLVLERRDLLAVLMAEPAAALTLLKVVATRLRRTSEQLEQASFGPMSGRLAQALLAAARDAAATGGPSAPIRMSQREIGNLIGLSRESTNRHLRAWHRAGIIDLQSGGVVIRDTAALARLAEA